MPALGECRTQFEDSQVSGLRRRLKRGQALFRAGDPFSALYTVRQGFFKTCIVDDAGREQVSGFYMAGDTLGLDGLGMGNHDVAAVALEDSEVRVLPFSMLERAMRENASLLRDLNAELAREIARGQGVMMLLGSLASAERLASFLIGLSQRLVARGYSPSDFHLRMSREEIGSYLGLKLETVSRLFSSFAREGVLEVDKRHVRIVDVRKLERRVRSPA